MKYTLGLDLGTNSIGWFLLDENNQIVDCGVVIFPIGTQVDSYGIEKTKNAKRREFRAIKRNLSRYYLSRKNLTVRLGSLGMLFPKDATGQDLKTVNVKGAAQGLEFYKLRTKALDEAIPLPDLSRIFYLMLKHKGFKSGSKLIIDNEQEANKEEGVVKGEINNLKWQMEAVNARTIGEYFYFMYEKGKLLYEKGEWHNVNEPFDERALREDGTLILHKNRGIRREGRYVGRWMYEDEFDQIWAKQKAEYETIHPNLFSGSKEEYIALREQCKTLPKEKRQDLLKAFKKTNYWEIRNRCLFYQRPLKSQKRYINKCVHFKSKRTAPVSSLLYQDFRVLKQLADLRYSKASEGLNNVPLPVEWRNKLFDYLQEHPRLKLRIVKGNSGESDVFDVLGLDRKLYKFNFDNDENDKYFVGNITKASILEAVGSDTYNKLQASGKLAKLWHLIYMKRDNEWLEETLNDENAWAEIAANEKALAALTALEFEDGYATYSSKLLCLILPYMQEGNNEHDALKLAGFIKEDPITGLENIRQNLRQSISQIKNQELRNPVVEKAVAEAIKLVNSILKKHPIEKDNWTIRIESTRELKKPKTEREKVRRNNSEKDDVRQKYAQYLNGLRSKGHFPFLSRPIQKNDSIIHKYELWLELGGDPTDPDFDEFSRCAKMDYEKRLKHKLWLECNRICPYTYRPINLSSLFSPNNEIEIEHILPLSRSLDNSFFNKTLTFSSINKEKKNLTAYEYIYSKGGEQAIKEFENRLKNAHFSKEKIAHFLKPNIEPGFANHQLSNSSYIAREVRKKMFEVCRNVYFTNGMVTAEVRSYDWQLGGLLERIRYEEQTGIDMDELFREFATKRKFFNQYRSQNGKTPITRVEDWLNVTDREFAEYLANTNEDLKYYLNEIYKFDAFKNQSGKKDRSDHRHHALDAFVIACCDSRIIQYLSTLNAQREMSGGSLYDYNTGRLMRERIERPFAYEELKDELKRILVVNKTPQRLMVAKKNVIHTKKGVHIQREGTRSLRVSLHKDTFYGKLKEPSKQGIDKPQAFVTRYGNEVYNFTTIASLKDVYEPNVREILKRRIEKYQSMGKTLNQQAFEDDPLYMYSPSQYSGGEPENPLSKEGKKLPVIKKVRTVFKDYRSMVELPIKNEQTILRNARYAQSDGNYLMAFYELRKMAKNGKSQIERAFVMLQNIEAARIKLAKGQLFPDEKEKGGQFLPLSKDCPYLMQGDHVVLYEDDDDKGTIEWANPDDIKRRLYVVSRLSSAVKQEKYEFGVIGLVKHNVSKAGAKYIGQSFDKNISLPFLENYHTQLNAIKVIVSPTGGVEPISNKN